jgi:two-component system, NtrC family, sensor kinase
MEAARASHPSGKRKKGLTRKLVLSMLLVGALPLLIGLLLAFFQGTQEIREVSGTSFEALATETARKLDLVIADELSRTSLLTINANIIHLLENRRDTLNDLTQEALTQLLQQENTAWTEGKLDALPQIAEGPVVKELERHMGGTYTYIDPGFPVPVITRSTTRNLYITDSAGRLVASLDPKTPYLHAEEDWWKGAFHNGVGQPFIGPVKFNSQYQTYTFTLALPIMDSLRYEAIGVLRRIYDAKEFFAPSIDIIRFGKTGHVMLIDSRGVVLSCPILPTGTTLSDHELIPLVTPLHSGWTPAPSDGHGGHTTSIIGFSPLSNTSRITQSSAELTWHMFVWQSSEELFGPIQHFFKWTAAFGFLGVGLLVTLGYLAAYRIAAPIRHLQEAARRIGRGEFQEPILLSTGDEIEELAEELNRMNQQLASQFAGLESQVELKTQEVKYLQESTAQILDSVPDPVIMIGPQEQVEYLNQASKEALVLKNGKVEGTPLFQLLQLDPKTQATLQQEIHQIHSSVLTTPTTEKSDRLIKQLHDPLNPAGWEHSGDTRRELRLNQRTYRYRWFAIPARPGKDPGVGLVLRDITEESMLQDQLIQGEKLSSLGVLSAGIGHELNNPLVGVIGLGEAIQEETESDHIKEYAKGIVQHGKRMASVVRDFTGHIGKQFSEAQTLVNINEQLERTLAAVKSDFQSSPVEVRTRFTPIPPLPAKPFEIGQAFTNVLTNAFQAMKDGGILEVTTTVLEQEIHITIRDTGKGIEPNHLPKVFDPFFTTKGQGEGSGLGLTVAHRIITKLGGQIRLDSEKNHGTVCLIILPIISHQPMEHKES